MASLAGQSAFPLPVISGNILHFVNWNPHKFYVMWQ